MNSTIYNVEFKWLTSGEFTNSFDSISMNFIPRIGDVVNVDGIYYDVKSVAYKSNETSDVTIYVNPIGDANEHAEFLKKDGLLKDTNPVNSLDVNWI